MTPTSSGAAQQCGRLIRLPFYQFLGGALRPNLSVFEMGAFSHTFLHLNHGLWVANGKACLLICELMVGSSPVQAIICELLCYCSFVRNS